MPGQCSIYRVGGRHCCRPPPKNRACEFPRTRLKPFKGLCLARQLYCCHDDTRLKLPDGSFTIGPVDAGPCEEFAGGRTHDPVGLRSFAFPPSQVLQGLSSRKTCRKSAPFRAGVFPLARPLSAPLQGGVRFLRHLLPAPSSAFLTVGFAA